jgi:hypothetical protein
MFGIKRKEKKEYIAAAGGVNDDFMSFAGSLRRLAIGNLYLVVSLVAPSVEAYKKTLGVYGIDLQKKNGLIGYYVFGDRFLDEDDYFMKMGNSSGKEIGCMDISFERGIPFLLLEVSRVSCEMAWRLRYRPNPKNLYGVMKIIQVVKGENRCGYVPFYISGIRDKMEEFYSLMPLGGG